MWPIWYEYPDRDASRIDYMPFGAPASIGIDDTARLTVTDWTGETLDGLDATDIITDDEQTIVIPEPVTQFTIQAKTRNPTTAHWNSTSMRPSSPPWPAAGQPDHHPIQHHRGIGRGLRRHVRGRMGRASGTVWTPSSDERETFAQLLVAMDRRLRSDTIVFDSRRLDPAIHARLYLTASSDRSSSKEPSPHGSPETTQNRRRAACGPASAAPLPINGLPANPTYATRSHYGLYQ